VGRYLAESAYLEAASIEAFEILARELAALGAPRGLVRAARAAARDEARHARSMDDLARGYRARSPRPRAASLRPLRSLEEVARENAVEGCVRETYGALLAHHQAAHAGDPAVRAAMRVIAREETRHAALAWRVARWARARLDAEARARIDESRRQAVAELRRALKVAPAAPVARACGLPDPPKALRLASSLAHAWA
jgi:hypothetical protein